jgi:hypothetical protein
MKLLYGIALFFIGSLVFSSCSKQESFSNIPAITFNSFTLTGNNSAILAVNFTDGDGDIGYVGDAENAQPDFFIEYYTATNGIFYKDTVSNRPGVFSPVIDPYTIPDVTPAGKNKALVGVIKINIQQLIPPGFPMSGDTLEFNVWLLDRAGHKSNVITTPPIKVP